MTDSRLKNTLLSMVRRYGFQQVDKSLHEISYADHQIEISKTNRKLSNDPRTVGLNKKKGRPNASEYVAKMELSSDRAPAVMELAGRFDEKSFLPSIGDVRRFCEIYEINVPKSRASAIPRVFKCIATMNAADITQIVDRCMFSGPSRLGPIADAIRGYRPANADAPPTAARDRGPESKGSPQ